MAGQKFQYDESGSTFVYFLLSFLALLLIPSTYYCMIKKKKEGKVLLKREVTIFWRRYGENILERKHRYFCFFVKPRRSINSYRRMMTMKTNDPAVNNCISLLIFWHSEKPDNLCLCQQCQVKQARLDRKDPGQTAKKLLRYALTKMFLFLVVFTNIQPRNLKMVKLMLNHLPSTGMYLSSWLWEKINLLPKSTDKVIGQPTKYKFCVSRQDLIAQILGFLEMLQLSSAGFYSFMWPTRPHSTITNTPISTPTTSFKWRREPRLPPSRVHTASCRSSTILIKRRVMKRNSWNLLRLIRYQSYAHYSCNESLCERMFSG